mmetsp:Transcript_32260/g.74268  ORF Transcript_32260/g.74268 Transcript_32260/m.74268 type:complete len:519 (+) Transcript_32260:1-1557(+)
MELELASPARSPGAQEQEQPPETDGAATLRGFPLLRSSTLQPSEASALWQRRPPQEAAPSLARAFSEPGRWNTPAAAAVHAGAHPRHPHHPRRARLAVATNLEAAADGEAGERVAPPMREADVQVVDEATGAHWLRHVAYYEEGVLRRRHARALPSFVTDGGERIPPLNRLTHALSQALTPSVERRGSWRRFTPPASQAQRGAADNGNGSDCSGESGEESSRSSRASAESAEQGAELLAKVPLSERVPKETSGSVRGTAGRDVAGSPLNNTCDSSNSSSLQSLTSPPPALPPGVGERVIDIPYARGAAPLPLEAAPGAAPTVLVNKGKRRRSALRGFFAFVNDKLLVPPVRATLLGLCLGLIPFTRSLLISESAERPAPLEWVHSGLAKLGDAAVPINLITLGASLAKGPDFSAISPSACAGIVVAKLLLMPLVALAAIAAISNFFPVHILHPFEQPFYFTMFVIAATPTANNVLIMCTIAGQDRAAMSTAIFVQYACSPVVLSLTICGFVSVMVDVI